ncbi:MAG: N-acetylmuramoyl-L-alanine amidase [Ruthenibacterium sp.]
MQTDQQSARRTHARRKKQRQKRILAIILAAVLLCIALLLLLRGCTGQKNGTNSAKKPDGWQYVLPTQPPFAIAMDAGHGGKDLGAVGCINEVDLTEKVVYFLNGWLKNDPNYTPVFCRADGEGATLAQRVEAANSAKADLLISIHGNLEAGGDTAYGFECYPAPPGRPYHEPSLRFAQLVAQGMQTAGATLRGESGVRYCYYIAVNGEESGGEYNKRIAEESDTTVQTAESFAMVDKVDCPALLLEQCFLTNADDVVAWGFEDGCARAARIYYESICAYFGTQPLAAA